MVVKIVDASALAAVLFGEPEAETVTEWTTGVSLAAPTLLRFEMTSICLKKIRRHPEARQALLSAFSLFARLNIEMIDVNHGQVLDLAERTGLTAYDASYLWLASFMGAELLTLDRQLAAAAATNRQNKL